MNDITKQVVRILFTIAFICLLAYLLWLVRYVIIYLIISAVIAIIGKPVVDTLSGKKWRWIRFNRNLAAAITLLIMVGITGGILSIFVPALMHEITVISEIDSDQVFSEMEGYFKEFSSLLNNNGSNNQPQESSENGAMKDALLNVISFDSVTDTFSSLLSGLGNLVFAIFSILFISFFFLREKFLFRNIVLAFIPDAYEERILKVTPRLKKNLSRYFTGLLIQISIITTLISVGLSFVGLNNTIVIGFFAGLINVIPYLGPIIGMAFGLILGLSQGFAGEIGMEILPLATLIIVVFGSVQMIDNFILQPFIFSNSINAHPLEIFIVISFAASFAGITGMIVAVPTYSVIRLLATEFFPDIKFIQRLQQSGKNKDESS